MGLIPPGGGAGATLDPAAILAAGGVTTEELFFQYFDDTSALADGRRIRWGCPFDLEILSIMIWSLTAVNAHAVNFWTGDLRKIIALDATHTPLLIARKTTGTGTNGEAMPVLAPWVYDSETFDPVNRYCAQGDLLDFLWTKGTATDIPTRMNYAIRYRPVPDPA